MKVHLIKKQSIEDYTNRNTQSQVPFKNWLSIVKYANWNKPKDILATFNSADILGNGINRVVFNIGGNNYRMICKYCFGKNQVRLFINWIGTHSEYTKLCKNKEQYTINAY